MSTSRSKRARHGAILELVEHYGTQAALANALGCTDAAVRSWIAASRVPWGRACQVQILTDGRFTASSLGIDPQTKKAGPRGGSSRSEAHR